MFDAGAECCAVIPTRGGNGAMEQLRAEGLWAPPRPESLEEVLAYGVGLGRGRVFADLWDADRLSACEYCRSERIERLRRLNVTGRAEPRISCTMCGAA